MEPLVTVVEGVQIASLIVGSYLFGAIPVGWLVCRVGFGVDIFEHGSGRSGTTNVYRTAGTGAAVIVFCGDLLKGFVPALIARVLMAEFQLVPVMVAVLATVGHNWSVFIGLRGGRGVATSWGSVMALVPAAGVVGIPIGIFTVVIGRYVSLASLAGAVGFLIGVIMFYALGFGVDGFGVGLIAVFVIFLFSQHLDNLRRLIAGNERRLAPWTDMSGSRDSSDHGSS